MTPWNVDLAPIVWVVVVSGIGVLAVRFTIWYGERSTRERTQRWRAAAGGDTEYGQEKSSAGDEEGAKRRESGENR